MRKINKNEFLGRSCMTIVLLFFIFSHRDNSSSGVYRRDVVHDEDNLYGDFSETFHIRVSRFRDFGEREREREREDI